MRNEMVTNINTDSLKGDYSNTYFLVITRLKNAITDKTYINELQKDLLEMFYRNQEEGILVSDFIGDNEEDFTTDLINAYYENANKGRTVINYLRNISTFTAIFMVFLLVFANSTVGVFLAIVPGIITGILATVVVKKSKNEFIQKLSLCGLALAAGFPTILFGQYLSNNNILATAVNGKLIVVIVIVLLVLGNKFVNYPTKE